MGFPDKVRTNVLIRCKRHCCLCEIYAGLYMELHHIEQRSDGGQDTEENCILLCFNCHAVVGSYNPNHPKGLKYKAEELKIRREQVYEMVRDKIFDIYSPSDSIKAKKLMEHYSKYLEMLIELDPCSQGIFVDLLSDAEGIARDLQLYEYAFENYGLDAEKCNLIEAIDKWCSILNDEHFFHLINDNKMLCFNNDTVHYYKETMKNLRLSISVSYWKFRSA